MIETPAADFEPHPAIYELTTDDLAALVRYQGANDVIDAVLAVAVEVYGDAETAITKCHETFLRRAANLRKSPDQPCDRCAFIPTPDGKCICREVAL